MSSILRGGRLTETRKSVIKFISSIDYDMRIAHATVLVNEAHILGLVAAKIIDVESARKVLKALNEFERKARLHPDVEDIHVLIEEYVTKRTGEKIGGQMHLGKSRNDQVVTAIRITLRDEVLEVARLLLSLENELLRLAGKHTDTVFPGYTHLQPAQPISFAHYLAGLGDAFLRDAERTVQAYGRINTSPMGAAAIAGTSFKLNRDLVARLLAFDGLIENSLDAVGTRDFAIETLSVCSMIALDISRLAHDLIFYSATDVGLIEIPDEFASTSSIMPQKKNPDPLEVMRARCAQVIGNFVSAATTMHALPSGFNLDFQEVTLLLWNSVDIIKSSLSLLLELIPEIKVDKEIGRRDSVRFIGATEIANILAREEGLPFRVAHRTVGRAVKAMLGRGLTKLTMDEWERMIGGDMEERTFRHINDAFNLQTSLKNYRTKGSPNQVKVRAMIRKRRSRVTALTKQVDGYSRKLRKGLLELRGKLKSGQP